MQKPAEIKKLYFIGAIVYAAGIGLESLLLVIAMLTGHGKVQITPGMVVYLFLPKLLGLFYPLIALWLYRQNTITQESTKRTAIMLPVYSCCHTLLTIVMLVVANTFMSAEWVGRISLFQSSLQIPQRMVAFILNADSILLFCACAEEYVLTHPAPDWTKRLSKLAVIFAGAGLGLQLIIGLFPQMFGVLFGIGNLVLPIKWKLILIGLILLKLPYIGAAVWFWRRSDSVRPVVKLTLPPILYYLPAIIGYVIGRFITLLAAQDGIEVFSAYNLASTLSGYCSVLYYVSLILTCCAGTIAYFENKKTPSDGETSNI